MNLTSRRKPFVLNQYNFERSWSDYDSHHRCDSVSVRFEVENNFDEVFHNNRAFPVMTKRTIKIDVSGLHGTLRIGLTLIDSFPLETLCELTKHSSMRRVLVWILTWVESSSDLLRYLVTEDEAASIAAEADREWTALCVKMELES